MAVFDFIKTKMATVMIKITMPEFVLTVRMENLNQKNLWRLAIDEC